MRLIIGVRGRIVTSAVVTPTSDVNRDALVHVLAPVVTCVNCISTPVYCGAMRCSLRLSGLMQLMSDVRSIMTWYGRLAAGEVQARAIQ